MAQQVFKSPKEQSTYLSTPFDTRRISQKKGETPHSLFESYRLTKMSPNDYYKMVGHLANVDPQKLMAQREKETNEISVADIRNKMKNGVKFDTPWIRLNDSGEKGTTDVYFQEGLHRMLAAGQEYGMDTKFPVYLAYENDPWEDMDIMSMDDFVNFYDKVRQDRWNKRQERERIKQQEIDDFYKKETADHFGVLLEAVTPELIKQYKKYEDDLFKDEWYD